MNRKQIGTLGETLAAQDYKKDGYMLLSRNYRTRYGELDLILKKQGLLVFAEVKTRTAGALIMGREAVDPHKQYRFILAVKRYLQQFKFSEYDMRFDVVEVELQKNGRPVIQRIEDAFTL